MHLEPAFAALALVVFVAFGTQALSGFGALAIAVPLAAHLYGIEELKTLLVPTSLVATAAIVLRRPGEVERRLLLGAILPLMAAGAAAGLLLAGRLDGPLPRLAFALLVTAFAARELALLAGPAARAAAALGTHGAGLGPAASAPLAPARSSPGGEAPAARPARAPSRVLLLGAGLLHGLYATGGPLLVFALDRAGLEKGRFRTTLAAVWLALNLGMTAAYAAEGRYDAALLAKVALLAPVTYVAGLAGAWAHDRVDERAFRRVVFVLLLVSGLSMAARAAGAGAGSPPGPGARTPLAHAAER
jgi:hypothetical protein